MARFHSWISGKIRHLDRQDESLGDDTHGSVCILFSTPKYVITEEVLGLEWP